jgi:chromosome partitioning protein
MNDSFIDLDLLAKIEPDTHRILYPSAYAEMVWEQKKARALRDRGQIDWIVMRNRLSTIGSRNKQAMEDVLGALSKRIGFRLAPGFGERVIFRELFLKGLTLLDMRNAEAGIRLNMSHVAARQEVRALLAAIGLAQSPTYGVADEAAGTHPV